MFSKKKKVREVFLTKSSIAVLDIAKQILTFILKRKKFELIHIHVNFFEKESQNQKVEAAVYFKYASCSIEFTLTFWIKESYNMWKSLPNGSVLVEHYNKTDSFYLAFMDEDGSVTFSDLEDEKKLKDLQRRLAEIYPQSP